MSNSIWKTKAIVPEENGKQILVKFQDNFWHTEKITRRMMREWSDYYETGHLEWCYLDELLAQADKAERLQKVVDNSREKLAAFMHDVWGNWFAHQLNNSTVENLQRWGIQSSTAYSSLTETDKDKDRKFADKIIEIIKDEIK